MAAHTWSGQFGVQFWSGFYETPWPDTEIRSRGRLGRLPRRLTARAGVPVDVTRGLETGLDGEDRRLPAPRRSVAVDGFRHGLAQPCDLGATHVVANRRRRHAQTAGDRRDAQRRRQAQPRPARANWMNVVGRPACRWATPGDVHRKPGPYAPRPRGNRGYDNAGTSPLSGSAVLPHSPLSSVRSNRTTRLASWAPFVTRQVCRCLAP